MVDDVFLSADVVTCPDVLGVRLRQLSIWHSWALRACASPFVEGGEYDTDDICQAVMICSLRKSEYVEADEEEIACLLGNIAAEWLKLKTEERSEVFGTFMSYIEACTRFPEFWRPEDTDATRDRLRCPAEWHLVATLTTMGMCNEAEAWDYPIAAAQCWQAVEGERAGSRSYVDAKDRADLAMLEEVEA